MNLSRINDILALLILSKVPVFAEKRTCFVAFEETDEGMTMDMEGFCKCINFKHPSSPKPVDKKPKNNLISFDKNRAIIINRPNDVCYGYYTGVESTTKVDFESLATTTLSPVETKTTTKTSGTLSHATNTEDVDRLEPFTTTLSTVETKTTTETPDALSHSTKTGDVDKFEHFATTVSTVETKTTTKTPDALSHSTKTGDVDKFDHFATTVSTVETKTTTKTPDALSYSTKTADVDKFAPIATTLSTVKTKTTTKTSDTLYHSTKTADVLIAAGQYRINNTQEPPNLQKTLMILFLSLSLGCVVAWLSAWIYSKYRTGSYNIPPNQHEMESQITTQ